MHTKWIKFTTGENRYAIWPNCDPKNRHNLIADVYGSENASKIAALPDLIDACKGYIEAFERIRQMTGWKEDDTGLWMGPTLHHVEDACKAAIAKAEAK